MNREASSLPCGQNTLHVSSAHFSSLVYMGSSPRDFLPPNSKGGRVSTVTRSSIRENYSMVGGLPPLSESLNLLPQDRQFRSHCCIRLTNYFAWQRSIAKQSAVLKWVQDSPRAPCGAAEGNGHVQTFISSLGWDSAQSQRC